MPVPQRKCTYPHQVVAVVDIPLVSGVTIPKGTTGWLVSYSHVWREPDVVFDGFGYAGVTEECIRAVRQNGHLIRRSAAND